MPKSSHLDRTSLVNKEFIVWPKRELFLEGPPREILARWGSQSERTIRFILPASGFSVKQGYWKATRILAQDPVTSGQPRVQNSGYIVINTKTICNNSCEVIQNTNDERFQLIFLYDKASATYILCCIYWRFLEHFSFWSHSVKSHHK